MLNKIIAITILSGVRYRVKVLGCDNQGVHGEFTYFSRGSRKWSDNCGSGFFRWDDIKRVTFLKREKL